MIAWLSGECGRDLGDKGPHLGLLLLFFQDKGHLLAGSTPLFPVVLSFVAAGVSEPLHPLPWAL